MVIRERAYARAALAGNPSDGYNGKTIAFLMQEFHAEVALEESEQLCLLPSPQDHAVFASVGHLVDDVHKTGYYGGIRLMKAAVKVFAQYCAAQGIRLPERNFTLQYDTNIPRQVGLGGSSAIITAVMRALMKFYDVQIPKPVLPNIVLQAETEELGLVAGLQDRVVQAYGGLVYMDFDKEYMDEHGYGRYENLDPSLLPPVYLAYRKDLSKESSAAHIRVRQLYELGDKKVIRTMAEIASLADVARALLKARDYGELARVINRNFDLRARIFDIRPEDMKMVQAARAAGASSHFCGSGGAITGTYPDESVLQRLRRTMQEAGYEFIVPHVAPQS